MILRAERAAVLGQPGEHLLCPCLVNQNVTAIAGLNRLLGRTGVARDDDAAVRGVESVSVALHGVFRGEGGDCDVCVSVDDSGLDFMGIYLPALGVSALVSLRICTCLNVNPIRLQDVLGHGLKSGRTVHFEGCAPTGSPSGKNEIRIASRVIGVEVGHKSYLQVRGLKCSDAPVENSGLSATYYARSEIHKIDAVVNNNGGRRTGTVRIRHGRARTQQHDPRSGYVSQRRLARWLLG